MMNGFCCGFRAHDEQEEDDRRRMQSRRLRLQSEYEQKMIFEKEEWSFAHSCSAVQEERRRSLALAKVAALRSGQDIRRVLSDDSRTEKRDNTTGYRQSQSLASPSTIWPVRSPCPDQHVGTRNDPTVAIYYGLWNDKEHWSSPTPMPLTPRSESSLLDLDEDDEQNERETELADRASLVEVPL
jgi:hypothetical protein